MIPSDRVIKAAQWSVTAGSRGSSKPDYVAIRLSSSPNPIQFTLNPQDAYDLASALMLIVKHIVEEGTAGGLKVLVSDEPNEAGIRLLRMEFPDESSVFFTDIVANAFAYNLLEIAERVIELNKE